MIDNKLYIFDNKNLKFLGEQIIKDLLFSDPIKSDYNDAPKGGVNTEYVTIWNSNKYPGRKNALQLRIQFKDDVAFYGFRKHKKRDGSGFPLEAKRFDDKSYNKIISFFEKHKYEICPKKVN